MPPPSDPPSASPTSQGPVAANSQRVSSTPSETRRKLKGQASRRRFRRKTLAQWRSLLAAGIYFGSSGGAAWYAHKLAFNNFEADQALRYLLLAMSLSWAVVALVRGLDGRFWQSASDKDPKESSGARLLRVWLTACVALFLALILADLAARLNIAGLLVGAAPPGS